MCVYTTCASIHTVYKINFSTNILTIIYSPHRDVQPIVLEYVCVCVCVYIYIQDICLFVLS